MAPSLDNADPLFALVISPVFYLHLEEVADQDPSSGSTIKYKQIQTTTPNNCQCYLPTLTDIS